MGCEPARVGFDDKIDSRSTKELVLSLRPEFQSSKFEFVASILASREEKLKREIEANVESLWLEREQARLEKMRLEEELKSYKTECARLKQHLERERLEAKQMEVRVTRLGEEIMKFQAGPFSGSGDAGRREVEVPPANRGESERLAAEGNGIGSSSGVKKVDAIKQLDIEMDVKKEKEDSVSGGIGVCKRVDERENLGIEMNVKKENEEQKSGGGGEIGANRSANLKSHQADTAAGKQGNARPISAATVVEISDSDDETTPPKEGTSKQPHVEAGHSGKVAIEDSTGALKRKYSSSGANDNSVHRPEKLPKDKDLIHIGRTVAAQARLEISDSDDETTPPKEGTPKQPHVEAGHSAKVAAEAETGALKKKYSSSSGANDYSSHRPEKLPKHQDLIRRTVAAQAILSSPKLPLAALAAMSGSCSSSSSSSSSSSDDDFDLSTDTTFRPCLR